MAAKKRGSTRKRKPAAKRATAKTKAKRASSAKQTRGAVKKPARRATAQRKAPARKAPARKTPSRKTPSRKTAPRIIAVMGATGSQGGGLVRAILADPKGGFAARAITRDPDSPKARELARLGAEVVAAEPGDRASLERAFAGAHGAYCVSFFWAHMSPEREKAEASAMAQAAKRAGVAHAIWSTLEDTRQFVPLGDNRIPTLLSHYKVPHFDAKAEADAYFATLGVPTTYLITSFYWDNFIHFGLGPKPGADGVLDLALPMATAQLCGIAAEDIGKCAYGIFTRGAPYIGRRVGIAGGCLTGLQMAASLGKALGKSIRYVAVPPDVYRRFGFPGAEELGNMFQIDAEFADRFMDARDLREARSLNPALLTFDAWAQKHKAEIPTA
ncbi:MAG TPA: NmrA family NAD(P)-binding protein [Gemmatimonadaceae bacterium]|nr:NmrA family NAD(P)-binding protein [Gemmatimonadaceae bacterium]